jgi:tetratricopeptide (TPR) repeat protein
MTATTDGLVNEAEAEKEFSRGLKVLEEGNSPAALTCFEKACGLGTSPSYSSYFGFCVARERGQVQRGILLCQAALQKEPENPVHYLNLGRIHLAAGDKLEAIKVFRKGLTYGPSQEIIGLLESIGTRKPPVFPSLDRFNPINKFLGKLLSKLGYR